jgi:hypothetical protein
MKRRKFISAVGKWLGLLFVTLSGRAQFATFQDRPFLAGNVSAAQGATLDTFESYAPGAGLDGLNGGTNWPSAYVDRGADVSIRCIDSFKSYADSASLNALDGGSGWNGAYVDR